MVDDFNEDTTPKGGRRAMEALMKAARKDREATRQALDEFVASPRFAAVAERLGEAPALALADDLRRMIGSPRNVASVTGSTVDAVALVSGELPGFGRQVDEIYRDGDGTVLIRRNRDQAVMLRLNARPSLLQIIALRVLQAEELASIIDGLTAW